MVETIGAATLYLGDCREVAGNVPRADLVLSDPPYKLTSGGDTGIFGGWMTTYNNKGSPVVCDIGWPEICAVVALGLADDADAYLFCNDKNVRALLNAAHDVGLGFHNLLLWDKVGAMPNRWYMKNVEFVGYFWKGRARTINDPGSKQLIRVAQVDESMHRTEKPVSLCRHYIENSTRRGQLVFDPFMGSGTTGVAAILAGRKFAGVECELRWFDVACRRIEAATRAPAELFA